MRITYLLLSLVLCLCPVMQAQNTTNQFMTQAQSSLEKKDYTKAEGTEKVSLQLFKELNLHIACILFGYVQIFCTLMP